MAGVSVRIGADTDGLDSAVKHSKSQMGELRKEMRDGVSQAAQWGAGMAAAAVVGLGALTARGLSAVDSLAKLSRSLDGTITAVQTLQMAAGDAGIEGMDSSLNRLNRRLGAAERGGGAAAKTVQALQLDLQALSDMDVDERMATIADAIRDSGASMQKAARYAQDLGFEQQAAAAFFMEGGDAIRAYRDDVAALGLSISNIDAAQVEAANNAMGIFGDAVDGISQQLAIEMAPILSAVSAMFEEAAKEAGGFASVTSSAFGHVVNATAFVIDAVEGIRRVFSVVADGIIAYWSALASAIARRLEAIVSMVDKIPGIDMSGPLESIRSFASQAESIAGFAMENIKDTFNEPMPGGQFKQFVADARKASEAAAEEAVKMQAAMRAAAGGGGGEGDGEESEAEKKRREQLEADLEAIRQANATEMEILNEKQLAELEAISAAREAKLEMEKSWDEIEKETKARHEDEITDIEKRAADARKKAHRAELEAKQATLGQILGNMSTLMNTESRKMFEIGKAAAIANSIVSTYQGMSAALKLGWPLGPIAAAAIGAKGFAQVAAIRSQSFGGGGGGGGAGGSGSVTENINDQTQPVQPPTQRNIAISVTGDSVSRDAVRGLIGAIGEEMDDNVTLAMA